MARQIFRIDKPEQYRHAGPDDLVQLLPVPGGHPLFVKKRILEVLAWAIVAHELVHLSGPTGSAKTSLIDALNLVPENLEHICVAQGLAPLPLRLFAVEMATYEAPGELYQRRAIKDGTTFDEESGLVEALKEAAASNACYPLIWLREMGRVHSSAVMGGLLNLMNRGDILLPKRQRISGGGIGWIADSNYQAEHDSTHTLVTLDDALRRRFTVNLTLDYLSAEQEADVMATLAQALPRRRVGGRSVDGELIRTVVKLGQVIRRCRLEGNLLSVTPPTIYGYLTFIYMSLDLPQLTLPQIAEATLLGNASREDQQRITGVLNEVFGLHAVQGGDPVAGENLF